MVTSRIQWADYAKGIAIIMVVIHHVIVRDTNSVLYNESLDYLNNLFIPFRMPLFFFVSGLFIHKTINSDFKFFFKFKFIHLLYLFILWSIIRYLTVTVPEHILLGSSDESLSSIFLIFFEPSGMLWFIYALAIFLLISWLTSSFLPFTFILSTIFFVLTINYPTESSFVNNLAHFYPFYLLGYFTSDLAHKIANRVNAYHLVVPVLFITLLVLTNDLTISKSALGVSVLSFFGIITGIIISSYLTKFATMEFLGYIGRNTLPIYLMHYFPIGVLRILLAPILPFPIITAIIIFIVAITTPLLMKKMFDKYGLNWLLKSPFVVKHEKIELKHTS